MDFEITTKGEIRSPLAAAFHERRLDIQVAPHPMQVISSSWLRYASALLATTVAIEGATMARKPPGETYATTEFRQLVYSATELFDAYTQLLIDRLGPPARADREKIRDYRDAGKKWRSPWALLCNKFKHSGAQIGSIKAFSMSDVILSTRFLILAYKGTTSLLRDDDIHKGRLNGICLVRATREVTHALLRVELLASRLVASLPDKSGDPFEVASIPLVDASVLQRLLLLPATALPDEPMTYNGFIIDGPKLQLCRCNAVTLPTRLKFQTTLHGDGISKTLSFQ